MCKPADVTAVGDFVSAKASRTGEFNSFQAACNKFKYPSLKYGKLQQRLSS